MIAQAATAPLSRVSAQTDERGRDMRLRPLVWLIGLALPAAMFPPGVALAAETETTHFSDTLVVTDRPNPCSGASGTTTITVKGLAHLTELDNGTLHVVMMDVGTLTFVPDDPGQPTYSGHLTETGFENHNSKSFTTSFTRNLVAVGSDGSRIKEHVLFHVTMNADGTVTASIDTEKLTCF